MSEDFDESDFEDAFEPLEGDAMPPMMPPMAPPQQQQAQSPMEVPELLPISMPQPQQQQHQASQQRQVPPQQQQASHPRQRAQQLDMRPVASPFAMVRPLPPGMGGPAAPPEAFFQRKIGGLPVWAWGAIAVVGSGVAYLSLRKEDEPTKKGQRSSEPRESREPKRLTKNGWEPSRGNFADALSRKYGDKIEKVYPDADQAKGALKTVSPLVNAKAKTGFAIDKSFESFCKAEGLHPVAHDDGEIGFYPADGTARGRQWEEYVDMLRDDGQTV